MRSTAGIWAKGGALCALLAVLGAGAADPVKAQQPADAASDGGLSPFAVTNAPAGAPSTAKQDPCADYIPQPKPQNASRDIVGQDLDTIVERGFMTFAVYDDFPPYSWQDGDTPTGVDVEIARLIADSIGVDARFTFVMAGENLETDLRLNIWQGSALNAPVVNVMMRVPYDSHFACRVEQVVFNGQYAEESIAIAYADSDYPDGGPVPAYFRFDTVAVENDSISDFYLSGFAGGQTAAGVRRYPTMAEAMQALADGEVMAAMGPRAQLEYGIAQAGPDAGISLHQPPLPGLAKSRWTLGTGEHFAYRPLAYTVDDAIAAGLQDGRIAAIFESYGLTHQPPDR
ncbi:substrate-binding periplasmic protein [Paracoccus tegillarcae]|uniref:Amino acid ABC transporter substrate-binding protein n=1 Tax=Paracoccus tegillarcae TaxID=1529068 RepID=A0A2K9EP90_9RHOB|nr:transporter substrate-binding domain-containing protein [Paracoccus tegillarcae]AUH33475.1 amino acid ABC transporter substrate-binding protein [Paracoccus tegillarcae]